MKKLLLIYISFLFSFCSVAPKKNSTQIISVDRYPVFKGCEQLEDNNDLEICFQNGFKNHIKNNFQYPKMAKSYGFEGKVYVKFKIDTYGKVSSAKVIKADFNQRIIRDTDRNDRIEESKAQIKSEALRLVRSVPEFIPAMKKGRYVTTQFTIPVTFYFR